MNSPGGSSEAICVGVRLRPFVAYETGQKQCLTITGNVVSVVADVAGKECRDFAFDVAMDSMDPSSPNYASQAKCYELMAQRMVAHIFTGYNTCLFCYGQTGTGKTTTIMGKSEPASEQGLLLRLLSDVFAEADRIKQDGDASMYYKVQMLEVYNEKIKDLLLPHGSSQKQQADVHVHPKLGVYLKGVTEEAVDNCAKCIKLIDYGNTMKTVAATAMNAKSSRSHTVFKLNIEKTGGTDNMVVSSEVFFVDLAGRENEKTTKVTGERLVELTFINRSLMWLAHCIQSLGSEGGARRKTLVGRKSLAPGQEAASQHRNSLAPPRKSLAPSEGSRSSLTPTRDMAKFRNSKLTLLLSNALSGNSKTSMIGTLSPAVANFEESFSTLNFANTVKNIKVEAKPASEVDKATLVTTLQEEVKQLKQQLAQAHEVQDSEEITQKLEGTEALVDKWQKKWEDSQLESAALMVQREEAMEKLGIARWTLAVAKAKKMKRKEDKPEALLPHLTNYSDDPHLCGIFVLYPEEVGKEYCIGHGEAADFKVPPGLGVSPKTCLLRRDFGRLFIRAVERRASDPSITRGLVSLVEVNGTRIGAEWVELQHQDCVVLGRSLMYYAFTKADGGIQALPTDKQRFPNAEAGSENSETLIINILGPKRGSDDDQVMLARKYYSHLQTHNMDADGATSLHNFLLQASRAAKMVDEANDITAALKPDSGLLFELTALAPVLAFGFGSSSFPEFCVRLVKRVNTARASRRVTIERMRRNSVHASMEMLRKFSIDGDALVSSEQAQVDVIHTWNFPKFTSRLQLMQDAHEAWASDPENFELDTYKDPWSEYGLAEIAQLRAESVDSIAKSKDECRMLRERERASSIAHEILTESVKEGSSSVLIAEVMTLRENVRLMEVENARLKAELARAHAEANAALKRLSASAQTDPMSLNVRIEGQSVGVQGRSQAADGREDAQNKGDGIKPSVVGDAWASASAQANNCLELSKANLSLVEDLFRLSISLLRAGTASLQASAADTGADSAAKVEQSRLADAASDLIAFFSRSGPFAPAAHHQQNGSLKATASPWASNGGVAPSMSQQSPRRTQVAMPVQRQTPLEQQSAQAYRQWSNVPSRSGVATPRCEAAPMVAIPGANLKMVQPMLQPGVVFRQVSPMRGRPANIGQPSAGQAI